MIIFPSCCHKCRPPKRNGYCHCNCKEYRDAKQSHEVKLAEERRKRKGETDAFAIAEGANRTHSPLNRKWWK